jgi:hypothetical protein
MCRILGDYGYVLRVSALRAAAFELHSIKPEVLLIDLVAN